MRGVWRPWHPSVMCMLKSVCEFEVLAARSSMFSEFLYPELPALLRALIHPNIQPALGFFRPDGTPPPNRYRIES